LILRLDAMMLALVDRVRSLSSATENNINSKAPNEGAFFMR
jgi:hypothetical protein